MTEPLLSVRNTVWTVATMFGCAAISGLYFGLVIMQDVDGTRTLGISLESLALSLIFFLVANENRRMLFHGRPL